MNQKRRKQIEEACKRFVVIDNKITECRIELESLHDEFEGIRDEEQEYLDNIPENLHGSDKYDIAQSSIQGIESLMNWLDCMVTEIDNAPNSDDLLNVI